MGKKKSSNKSTVPTCLNAGAVSTVASSSSAPISKPATNTSNIDKSESGTASQTVPLLTTPNTANGRTLSTMRQLHHHLRPGAAALLKSASKCVEESHTASNAATQPPPSPLRAANVSMAEALKQRTAATNTPPTASTTSATTAKSEAGAAAAVGGSGGAHGAGASSSSSVPTSLAAPITLVLSAAARMDALLVAEAKATSATHKAEKARSDGHKLLAPVSHTSGPKPTQHMPSLPSDPQRAARVAELTTLAKLIMWYCLDTVRGAGALRASGGGGSSIASTAPSVRGSHPSAHHATPSPLPNTTTTAAGIETGTAETTATPTGATQGASTTSNADGASSGLSSWLGSRMSTATTPSALPHTSEPTISDEHLAATLLRPGVEMLAQFSCFNASAASPTTHGLASEEVRACAVWLFACLLTRFPGASLNACLPRLFPEEDVRRGPHVRHPLLHPLIWEPMEVIRTGAQLSLGMLLHALHPSLQYAQEPRRDRQSFVSMATQGGAILLALHEALEWALSATTMNMTPPGRGGATTTTTAAAATTPAQGKNTTTGSSAPLTVPASLPHLLSTFAATIAETPYRRCGQCQRCVLRALALPVLRTCLSVTTSDLVNAAAVVPVSSTTATTSTSASPSSSVTPLSLFLAGTAWLTQILNNDSLQAAACAVLFPRLQELEGGGGGGGGGGEVPRGGSAKAPHDVLHLLFTHAPDRFETWSCVVQLARLHPSLLHDHFSSAISASETLVARLSSDVAQLSEAVTRPPTHTPPPPPSAHQEPTPSKHAAAARRVAPTAMALSECLRAWLHFMGYVWKSFDNNAEDPGFDPALEKNRASASEKRTVHHALLSPVMTVSEAMLSLVRASTTTGGATSAMASALSSPSKGMHSAGAANRSASHASIALLFSQDLPRATEELIVAVLRCLAQMGDDHAETLTAAERDPLVTFTAKAVDGTLAVSAAENGLREPWAPVQAEALTTVGMWAWQYPSLVRWYGKEFVSLAVMELIINVDPTVRAKAGFALSNMCSRLAWSYPPTSPTTTSLASIATRQQYAAPVKTELGTTCHEDALPPSPSGGVRESPEMMLQLCNTAVQAVLFEHVTAVQGHGIRMMNYLLQTMSASELTSLVLEEPEGQCVAHGFLHVLLDILHPMNKHEAKLRWNTACALGMFIARAHLMEAEPVLSAEAVDALCVAVSHDRIFKVRTQSANALAMVCTTALPKLGVHSTTPPVNDMERADDGSVDLTARVVRSLCAALEAASATENFRQFREQGPLLDAVRAALSGLLGSIQHSRGLDKVMEMYKPLLTKSELL